ncbi:Hypothetical predicted protein, partial [Marmota monax]
NLKLMLGNFKSRIRDGTEQTINPIQIIRYWNHSDSSPQDDLMLIKLAKPAILNQKVQLLPLATSNVRPGTVCLLSGLDWSRENNGEYTSHRKLRSSVFLKEEHTCPQSCEKRGGEIMIRDPNKKLQEWSSRKCPEQSLSSTPRVSNAPLLLQGFGSWSHQAI